ncbi:TRAP transporter small permease [Bradyrhizobium sp. LHD-71]|uniref:TRAP transporter small permease n=1 Tax=Bradyrhizobium sp. LHD-71 TaxID=3072141 RepID=UPI00280D2DFE|nr:TRAP transporter small permease [Bradyrhizobium sp. LHD-71]MDQ8726580.1 TRAP transporter small permease [Bradyrhizobium sp. LHD-71]
MQAYFNAMDVLHRACVFIAGVALVVIVIIIPYGVFTRYVLNSASSWPEPMAILLMIVLSFLSAVVCYREHMHIGVGLLPSALRGLPRTLLGIFIELAMLATNLFLLWYGIRLVQRTWHQSIAEFPVVSVGVSYLPVPIVGFITILFIIERFMKGDWFPPPPDPDDPNIISTE